MSCCGKGPYQELGNASPARPVGERAEPTQRSIIDVVRLPSGEVQFDIPIPETCEVETVILTPADIREIVVVAALARPAAPETLAERDATLRWVRSHKSGERRCAACGCWELVTAIADGIEHGDHVATGLGLDAAVGERGHE